jgi:RNA polymerase sigma factor (sigma-70 family)
MEDVISPLTAERSRFLAVVQRRVRDRATAEDILQAAYARAVRQACSLKSGDSSEAWFYRILRNGVIDYHRHRAVEDRSLTPLLDREHASPEISSQNLCRCMESAIEQVRPAYRQILKEVELDETSLKGFAEREGISAGAAAVRAHRARTALHRQLVHHCGSCSDHAGCLDCTCTHA